MIFRMETYWVVRTDEVTGRADCEAGPFRTWSDACEARRNLFPGEEYRYDIASSEIAVSC